jgi:hypothetical protein
MSMKVEIAKAIALLTAEYDLPAFGPERIEMWMEALSCFPAGAVTRSATNYIRSNKFKPQLADIIDGCAKQLDANWLGADEAWGLVPKSEHDSAMLTNEIAEAVAAARTLMEREEWTAARMTFKDTYSRLVDRAKLEGRMPAYFPSFGADPAGRVVMLATAVQKGQISMDRATEVLPEHAVDLVKMCGVAKHPLLAPPKPENVRRLKSLLLTLKTGA